MSYFRAYCVAQVERFFCFPLMDICDHCILAAILSPTQSLS